MLMSRDVCFESKVSEFFGKTAAPLLDHGVPLGVPPALLPHVALQLLQVMRQLHGGKAIGRDIRPHGISVDPRSILRPGTHRSPRLEMGAAEPPGGRGPTLHAPDRWYLAPELLLGMAGDAAADVWSLGCTLAELATGEPLLPGQSSLDQLGCIARTVGPLPQHMLSRLSRELRGSPALQPPPGPVPAAAAGSAPTALRQRLGSRVGAPLMHLLEECLRVDPRERPTMEDLLRMPYFLDAQPWLDDPLLERARWKCGSRRLMAPPCGRGAAHGARRPVRGAASMRMPSRLAPNRIQQYRTEVNDLMATCPASACGAASQTPPLTSAGIIHPTAFDCGARVWPGSLRSGPWLLCDSHVFAAGSAAVAPLSHGAFGDGWSEARLSAGCRGFSDSSLPPALLDGVGSGRYLSPPVLQEGVAWGQPCFSPSACVERYFLMSESCSAERQDSGAFKPCIVGGNIRAAARGLDSAGWLVCCEDVAAGPPCVSVIWTLAEILGPCDVASGAPGAVAGPAVVDVGLMCNQSKAQAVDIESRVWSLLQLRAAPSSRMMWVSAGMPGSAGFGGLAYPPPWLRAWEPCPQWPKWERPSLPPQQLQPQLGRLQQDEALGLQLKAAGRSLLGGWRCSEEREVREAQPAAASAHSLQYLDVTPLGWPYLDGGLEPPGRAAEPQQQQQTVQMWTGATGTDGGTSAGLGLGLGGSLPDYRLVQPGGAGAAEGLGPLQPDAAACTAALRGYEQQCQVLQPAPLRSAERHSRCSSPAALPACTPGAATALQGKRRSGEATAPGAAVRSCSKPREKVPPADASADPPARPMPAQATAPRPDHGTARPGSHEGALDSAAAEPQARQWERINVASFLDLDADVWEPSRFRARTASSAQSEGAGPCDASRTPPPPPPPRRQQRSRPAAERLKGVIRGVFIAPALGSSGQAGNHSDGGRRRAGQAGGGQRDGKAPGGMAHQLLAGLRGCFGR